jgi:hypothetical protein
MFKENNYDMLPTTAHLACYIFLLQILWIIAGHNNFYFLLIPTVFTVISVI